MSALPPFQRVLEEHSELVWRYLVGMVGRTDADDVFQETFLAAMRAYPSLSTARDHSPRAWVMTIAHRKALDHIRAAGRRAVPLAEPPEVAVEDSHDLGDEALWDKVRALPPKMRAAVTLRFAADLSHAEVAAALGCSEEAARRSTHEGLTRLRKAHA